MELLRAIIEEEREVPRDQRQWLLVAGLGEGDILQGPTGSQLPVARIDVEELDGAGLLRSRGPQVYVTTAAARQLYANERSSEAAPAASAEREVRGYLDGAAFAAAHPQAHALWAQTQALLWGADSEQELTTIGHKTREAMQAFATELVERYAPPGVDPDPAHVNRRVGAVIAMHVATVGESRATLLKALGGYSEATMDLIQRQEHGAQKEGGLPFARRLAPGL